MPIAPDALRRRCDPARLAATDAIEPLAEAIGQPRALEALELALAQTAPGYNVFASGPAGTGRRTLLATHLRAHAAQRPVPPDRVYVRNFAAPDRPLALALPAGTAERFAHDVRRLVEEARERIRRAFESESYDQQRARVAEELQHRQQEILEELRGFALQRGIALELSPAGILTIPILDGRPATPQQFAQLSPPRQRELEHAREEVEAHVRPAMLRLRAIEREAGERFAALDREVALFAAGHLVEELVEQHREAGEAVAEWLGHVREDLIEHVAQLRALAQPPPELPLALREDPSARYEVNVLVANAPDGGAPVLVEVDPSWESLFGRIGFQPAFAGGLTTDHRLIRAGALHRADGGFLVLDAADVLGQPFAWAKLKEVLRTGELRMENVGARYTLFPTAMLEPEPVPIAVKVVLVGSAELFAALHALDEDMGKLFKVKADFDIATAWDEERERQYAAFVSRQVRDGGLRHFEAEAVARVVEHGARLVDHRERLSTRFRDIADLVVDADACAAAASAERVAAEHVGQAVAQRVRRSNLLEQRLDDLVAERTIALAVDGEQVGQVNGLAVMASGGYAFGEPVRITAAVAPGDGGMVDIDRETKLGGPIHNKGFLILTGFLMGRWGRERRLSLDASVVFEQTYGGVEGDSASCAELLALLSALGEVPLRQGVAVTGSIDQLGRVQAVGGVNEKIEGFHRICTRLGLTGRQGVVIPAANLPHLMLSEEVVDAVRDGSFNVWAASTVEDALALLAAGPAEAAPPQRVAVALEAIERRLDRFAEIARAHGRGA